MSLWQRAMPVYVPAASGLPTEVEIAIVGGGITGLTTALLLQRSGKKCILLEAQNIAFGTSGGTTAHLNTVMDTPYYQVKKDFGEDGMNLLARGAANALELISRNVKEYNIPCYHKNMTAYIFSQNENESEELDKIHKGNIDAGVQCEYVSNIPVSLPFTKAIMFSGQAQFHPTQYLYGLAKAFENAGGIIIQNCAVTDVSEQDTIIEVSTQRGKIKAQKVVYATHIPPGVNRLHFYCAPYRSYALAVKLRSGTYPDALIYDMEDPYHYYRTQEINGEKFLIAGGEDHKTGHEEDTRESFHKLEHYLRRFFDIEKVEYQWSSQYYEPADGLPYIGKAPGGNENIYVATGFGGNGLPYGTLSAIIISELICNGKSEFEELFNPSRIKPVAGFDGIVKNAADMVGQLASGWLNPSSLESLKDIKRGDGKVIKHENLSLAVYREVNGSLYALNSSCPHIKCNVKWNSAEKSWDCPCHGSRFSINGELLTAPARKGLEKIDLRESDSEKENKPQSGA